MKHKKAFELGVLFLGSRGIDCLPPLHGGSETWPFDDWSRLKFFVRLNLDRSSSKQDVDFPDPYSKLRRKIFRKKKVVRKDSKF